VRYLIGCAVIVLCGLVLLWREARTLARETPDASSAAGPASAQGRVGDPARRASAGASAAGSVSLPASVAPPGGVRTWSATATATDGPDPFAPVPQVRSLDETRVGLDDPR
jgi:hypothetical protein